MYTKLWAWNMTELDSIIFLDTDMIVKGSLRNLFELVTERHGELPPYEFAATGDVWPETFDTFFNAGFFVVRPSKETFDKFMERQGDNLKYDGGTA
jgi:glycogenin